MPTETGRAFTTGNFLANLAALKAINFGSADPAGVWFLLPNGTTGNVEAWVWQPASTATADDIAVVKPDSIVPGSPGRCIQQLRFDASQLGGVLAGIALLNTAGLIERTSGGGAGIVELSAFIRTLLNDADATAARTTLGIGDVAARTIGTNAGQIRDAADGAYSDARIPTTHASTHAVGGTDSITVFGYLAVSANSTLTTSNQRQLIDVNATAGVVTINLPSAVTVGSGWAVQIRKSDSSANLVAISRAGSDTINGATTLSLAVQHQSLILFSLGGTSWGVVAGFPGTLPANTLWGRGVTAGPPEAISTSIFALLASPAFTGFPTVPTAAVGTNTTQAASTAFVGNAITSLINSSPTVLDTLGELATALGNDPNFATTIANSLGLKAPLVSPTFTGTVTIENALILPSVAGATVGMLWRNANNLEFKDSANTTQVLLNSAGNLSNLSNKQAALNTLVGAQTANRVLKSNGTNMLLTQVGLTTDVTGILPIANGGTGSSSQNFVDLTTAQTIAGFKGFSSSNTRFGTGGEILSTQPSQVGFYSGYAWNGSNLIASATSGGFIGIDFYQIGLAFCYESGMTSGSTSAATAATKLLVSATNISIPITTASTSTTTGALVVPNGGVGIGGNLNVGGRINFSGLPSSSLGLSAGSLWRNGSVINIV